MNKEQMYSLSSQWQHFRNEYQVLDLLPGEETISYTGDTPNLHDVDGDIPVEFLNTLNYPGYHKHQLRLKKNMILMLMRNINKRQRLCNGTRLILKNVKDRTLEFYNPTNKQMADIPRIKLKSNIKKEVSRGLDFSFLFNQILQWLSINPRDKSLETKWEFIYTKMYSFMDSYMLHFQE